MGTDLGNKPGAASCGCEAPAIPGIVSLQLAGVVNNQRDERDTGREVVPPQRPGAVKLTGFIFKLSSISSSIMSLSVWKDVHYLSTVWTRLLIQSPQSNQPLLWSQRC